MPPSPPHHAETATEAVIARLALDLQPASHHFVGSRVAQAALVGAAVAILAVALSLGFRPDMPIAARTAMFWIKLGYGIALGLLALRALSRLSRPGAPAATRLAFLLLPLAAVAALGACEMAASAPSQRSASLLGKSWTLCPWRIVAFSTTPFLALLWAVRGLAPTGLRMTGAVLGLSAGGFGAAAYALYCQETTGPFLALWYTLGVLLVGALGALVGPRALRW